MPSGRLVRQNAVSEDSDYSSETTSSSSSEEEETTPQIEPENLHQLIEMLQDKGGISLSNCQEVNMIRWAICEAINDPKQEHMRNACLTLFDMNLNLANMFLIHYNKGKDKMPKMSVEQFKSQKPK